MANGNYIVTIHQADTNIIVEAPMPDSFEFDVGATYEQMLPQGFVNNTVMNIAAAMTGTRLASQALTAQLWAGNTDSELSFQLDFHTESDPIADVRDPIVNLLKLVMPTVSTNKYGFLGSPGPQLDLTQALQEFGTAVSSAGGVVGEFASTTLGAVRNLATEVFHNILGTTPKPGSLTDTTQQVTDGANNTIPKSSNTQNPGMGTAAYWNSKVRNKITIDIGNYLHFDSVVITRISQTYASNFDAQTGWPHHVRVTIAFKPLFMLAQEDLDSLFVNPYGKPTYNFSTVEGAVASIGRDWGFHL
jgi:hypothetical protein